LRKSEGAGAHCTRWLIAFTVLCAVAAILVPAIPQPLGYHAFADQRRAFGIVNFCDVASNAGFLVAGLWGLVVVLGGRAHFEFASERWPWSVFFLGMLLAGLGSSYYHLAPDNDRLFWDRLPMTIAFMGILSSVIAERINLRVGLRLLWPLVVIGALSTLYWHMGELRGVGDLRPYALVQFGTMVAIPLILRLFPPRYTRTVDMAWVIGWYALAKVFEFFDHGFFHVTGVSGHTLKHLASAVGAWWILRMLQRRRPLPRAG
jgi:hypothetical protein